MSSTEEEREQKAEQEPSWALVRVLRRRIVFLEGELDNTKKALRLADEELLKQESEGATEDEAAESLLARFESFELQLRLRQGAQVLYDLRKDFQDADVARRLCDLESKQKTDRDAVTEVALLGPKFANLESRLQELTDLYRDLAAVALRHA